MSQMSLQILSMNQFNKSNRLEVFEGDVAVLVSVKDAKDELGFNGCELREREAPRRAEELTLARRKILEKNFC